MIKFNAEGEAEWGTVGGGGWDSERFELTHSTGGLPYMNLSMQTIARWQCTGQLFVWQQRVMLDIETAFRTDEHSRTIGAKVSTEDGEERTTCTLPLFRLVTDEDLCDLWQGV